MGEENREQLEIVPMQIRVIKYICKVYGCRGCETYRSLPTNTRKKAWPASACWQYC
ncbi:IS66 family transposase zinc-finger binding domain-containing protein [Pseudomonas simiae]|uniref:IS66 family transposase zinc-finger binding domain-containing protein n=1 Tax=Pseudomonas simiae TaxID=321846 RepID=UPI0039C72A48